MATPVFTTRHGAQGHPAASTRWLQGPGPGVRSREVGCSVALAAGDAALTCRKRHPLRPRPGGGRTAVDGQRRRARRAARPTRRRGKLSASGGVKVVPDACGCCSTTRRRRDKSGGIRHDPDPQQRTPPLVGGGGDPEQLHGLTRSTTSASQRHRGGHAPIRSTGLGRGTCLPQKRLCRRGDVSVGCRRAYHDGDTRE